MPFTTIRWSTLLLLLLLLLACAYLPITPSARQVATAAQRLCVSTSALAAAAAPTFLGCPSMRSVSYACPPAAPPAASTKHSKRKPRCFLAGFRPCMHEKVACDGISSASGASRRSAQLDASKPSGGFTWCRRCVTNSSLFSGPCSCSGRHRQSSCSRSGITVAASGADAGAGVADGAKGADRQVGGNEMGAAPPPRQRLQAIQQRIKQKQAAAAAEGDTAYSLAATQVLAPCLPGRHPHSRDCRQWTTVRNDGR